MSPGVGTQKNEKATRERMALRDAGGIQRSRHAVELQRAVAEEVLWIVGNVP